MDCRQFLEELSDYIDGEVPEAVREAILEHTAFCRKCEVLYNSTRHTLEIVTAHGHEAYEIPKPVSDRLYSRLRARMAKLTGR